MKIIPIDIIKSMSGKICRHSDTSITLNHTSGKMHTAKLCNPYTGPDTEKQRAVKAKFADKAKKVSAWLVANRPTTLLPKGSDLYIKAVKLKKAFGLSSVNQVVHKYIDDDGTVKFPDVEISTGGGGSTGGTGGTGGGSGSGSGDDDI